MVTLTLAQALQLAKKHIERAEFKHAKFLYERILAAAPGHSEAQRALAMLLERLQKEESADKSKNIPKAVMQTWKNDQLPSNFQFWSKSIKHHNPDYSHIITDDKYNKDFVASYFPWFLARYESYPREIQRVDAFRYFYLFYYGGFYMDLDVECLQSLDRYLNVGDIVFGRMGPDPNFSHSIPNAIMAARPRQEFWLFVFSALLQEKNLDAPPELTTGPAFLKNSVDNWTNNINKSREEASKIANLLQEDLRLSIVPTSKLCILPTWEWYPLSWADNVHVMFCRKILTGGPMQNKEIKRIFPKTSLVTYWSGSWRDASKDKTSLFI